MNESGTVQYRRRRKRRRRRRRRNKLNWEMNY
jgi:hypothetical protein